MNDFFFNTFRSLNFLFEHYGKPIAKLKPRNIVVEERNTSFAITVLETVKKMWVTSS